MRDFHVSPAMGVEDGADDKPSIDLPDDPSAGDRFRRIAKLAMVTKINDLTSSSGPQAG